MAETGGAHEAVMGPIEISRVFDAPRELVFEAWTKSEHLERWFHPNDFTTPSVEIDFRVGGVLRVSMRSPQGEDFWSDTVFREIVPPERIAFTAELLDEENNPQAETSTTVTFAEEGGKTRLTLNTRVDRILDPTVVPALEGTEEGWKQALDILASYLAEL